MSLPELWDAALCDARVSRASWHVELDGSVVASSGVGEQYGSASMIKTFVALALTSLRPEWSDPVVISREDVAPSDGIARSLSLPLSLPLRDAVTLAIALSDNTASNTLIRVAGGVDHVNAELERLGFSSSRLLRFLGRGDAGTPLGLCTVAEHARAVSLAMDVPDLRHALLAQQDRRSLARWLPEEVQFAHKTGTDAAVRHDGGVLIGPDGRRLSATCMTDGGPEPEHIDHPACVAMGTAMAWTLRELGWAALLVPGAPAIPRGV